jgi:hypothetical protein
MDREMSAVLMRDFSDGQLGYKPVTWCRACSDAVKSRREKSCENHASSWCDKCKTTITKAHNCLTFVGHADARARLCEADPEWTWEPFEFPGTGALIVTDGSPVGLWIRLTIGGVSKPGFGSVEKGKPEAMKELIGDALRNAALSFGVAWKLWAKGERTDTNQGDAPSGNGSAANGTSRPAGQTVRPAASDAPPPPGPKELDPDAQPYADEAFEARTIAALKDANARAREAHKLASLIKDPADGTIGGLGRYIGYRKRQLEDVESALTALNEAANKARVDATEVDVHVKQVTGKGIEDASAAELRQAAEALTAVPA